MGRILAVFLTCFFLAFVNLRCASGFGGRLLKAPAHARHLSFGFAATSSEQHPPQVDTKTGAPETIKNYLKPPIRSSNRAENLAILLVYFVQGAIGLAGLARSFFLKDQLGLDPASSAAILGAATLPWTFKPLYGFLSDSVPLFGYRKRSYLIL